MVALAQELIDAIVDEVALTDKSEYTDSATLKACSLAARTFVAPSQRHLFRLLTLTPTTAAKMFRRFTASPHLAAYFRDITVDLWFLTDYIRHLVSIFPLLTGVRRLISRCPVNWDWRSFPANFRAALVALLFLPALQCVAFIGYSGVPSFIIRHLLLSCKQVLLSDVYIDPGDKLFPITRDDSRTASPCAASLHHLTLGSSSTSLHTLILGDDIAPQLKRLRHLELCASISGSLSELAIIALRYSCTIQHLGLHFHEGSYDGIELPELPNVPILTLTVPMQNLAPVFSAIICLPERMPRLQTVMIVFDKYVPGAPSWIHRPEVDRAFTNLPHLRQVHFSLPPAPSHRFVLHSANWLRAQFPMAYDAALLTSSERSAHEKQHPMGVFSP
ncbi:hypothetical protein FB451DRAFT_1557022 [Mycena latifolia]|nr:hypothetical protein FB451DRAFT_1557022 [Mycena latifolia]